MVAPPGPDPDLPPPGADGAAAPMRKGHGRRKTLVSARSFLLASTGITGLLLVTGIGLWLARIPLAEAAVAAALRTRGVEAVVELHKFDLGGLEAAAIRLGPADAPTLETGAVRATYHFDWSTGRLSLDQVRADGVVMRLATDGRSLDLGALKPLLESPAGPRRVDLVDVDLGRVRLEVATPWGLSQSDLSVRGSDRAGWTVGGRAGIPPGLGVSTPVLSNPGSLPVGVPVGVNVQMPPAAGAGGLLVGFAVRPADVDLGHAGTTALGLTGRVAGWVRLGSGGDLTAAVTSLDLAADLIRGPGLNLTEAGIVSDGLTWRQGPVWNQDAQIGGRLQLRAGRASLRDTAVARFDAALDLARQSDGAASLTVSGSAGQLVVPGQTVGGVTIDGRFDARVPDLLLPGGWSIAGESAVGVASLALPLPVLPGPDATRLPSTWQVQGRVAVTADSAGLAARPLGALVLGGAGSDRLVIQPSGAGDQGLRLAFDQPGTGPVVRLNASVAGEVDGAVVTSGRLGFSLDDSSTGQAGWTLDIADLDLTGLRVAGYRVDASGFSGSLAARPGSPIAGRVGAQVRASGLPGAPVGLVALAGRLDGQIEGASATARMTGTARQASVGGFTAQTVDLTADLALDWRGGPLLGRATTTGTARQVVGQGVMLETVAFTTTAPAALRLGAGRTGLDGGYRLSARRIESRDVRLQDAVSVGRVRLETRGAGLAGTIEQQAQASRLTSAQLSAQTVAAQTRGTLTILGNRTVFSTDFSASLSEVETGGTRFDSARIDGPVTVTVTPGRTRLSSTGCLDLATGAVRAPSLQADGLIARLCPDAEGQLAQFGPEGLALAGAVRVEPTDLTLASGAVRFGAVEGTFRPHPSGWAWEGSAPGLELEIPLDETDPTARARIRAERASVTLRSDPAGVSLSAGLEGISARGLPVAVAGDAQAELALGASGLAGTFAFTKLLIEDVAEADLFGAVMVTGTGTVSPQAVSMNAVANESRTGAQVATINLNHDITTGAGTVVADLDGLVFNPSWRGRPARQGLQPADLVPPLRGLVGEAQGSVIGSATVSWAPGTPMMTEGLFAGTNLSFATLAGPFDQVSATVSLLDLLNPTTNGVQRLTIGTFNPGIPLENGVVLFELRGDRTIQVVSARWPFAGGTLELDPASIAFEGGDQSFVLRANGIELSQFLELTQVPNLRADGTASGVLPVVVRDGVAEIVGGRLTVDADGGTIRYLGPDASGNLPRPADPQEEPPGFIDQLLGRDSGAPPQGGADLAVAALRNFQFKVLELSVDGRVTGDLNVGVVLEGANPDVLAGTPFRFNIRATGPMMRLMQNIGRLTDPQGYVDIVTAPGATQPQTPPPPDPASPSPPPAAAPTQTAPGPEDPAPPT